MRTALALVVVLGLFAGGVAISAPKEKKPLKMQPAAAPGASEASAIPGIPAGPPISPRGWIITTPRGGATVARMVQIGASGWQDIDPSAMTGSNSGGDTMFSSPSLGAGQAWIKVRVNGYSEAHTPYGNGFGTGPAAPGGNFTLSGGITVTAVP